MSHLQNEDLNKCQRHKFKLVNLTNTSRLINITTPGSDETIKEQTSTTFTDQAKLFNPKIRPYITGYDRTNQLKTNHQPDIKFLSPGNPNLYPSWNPNSCSTNPILQNNISCKEIQSIIYNHANYNNPYLLSTCSIPIIYNSQFYSAQPVPLLIFDSNSSTSTMIKAKKTNVIKKKLSKANKDKLNFVEISEREDNDIVHDFIMKCPSHLKFILKNKLEAGRILSNVTLINAAPLFNCLEKDLDRLIVDSYGNYFVQELSRFISHRERLKAWHAIRHSLSYYGTHKYAHHVLQLLIELSVEQEQFQIIEIIKPCFETLLFDSFGCHIIQKIIIYFYDLPKQELVQFLFKHFFHIISNPQGVCSVKMYIKSISREECAERPPFYHQILSNLSKIVNEKSAHYALLCIFEVWNEINYKEVIEHLSENFIKYSTQKYAARLVEKSILMQNKVSCS